MSTMTGKRVQQRKKPRAAEKRLPDDLYEQHIFPKLSLHVLLKIRRTCKAWNRVILQSQLKDIDLKRCMVHVTYSHVSKVPVALSHNPIEGAWRRILFPCLANVGSGPMSFREGDGPFVVQVSYQRAYWVDGYIRRAAFTVHNIVKDKYRRLPEPEPVPPCPDSKFSRELRLLDATQVDYKGLLISRVTPRDVLNASTGGLFYTHIYTSATKTWRFIGCLPANGSSETGNIHPWLQAGCFDGGKFHFLTFNQTPGTFEKEVQLWVFHPQDQAWSYIPTEEIYASGTSHMFMVKFLTCMGKLLAVAPCLDFETTTDAGKPSLRFIIFKFLGLPLQGVTGTPVWKELSRMPQALTIHGKHLTENFLDTQSFLFLKELQFPVVNEVIYIAPAHFRGNRALKRLSVIYNFRDNSWKKLSSHCYSQKSGSGVSMSLAAKHVIPCGCQVHRD